MDNIERRNKGLAYIADEACFAQMSENAAKLYKYNNTLDTSEREKMLKNIFGRIGENCTVLPPLRCDYGFNVELGDNVFINYNFIALDVAKIKIGDNVFIAPNVSVYTAGHPIHWKARNTMYEYGIAINIGSNCWIGGNTVICPGVSIGDCAVIGAGSVVTKDIPPCVVAAGNPCRVIREITDEDKRYYFKNREFDPEAMEAVMNSGRQG